MKYECVWEGDESNVPLIYSFIPTYSFLSVGEDK